MGLKYGIIGVGAIGGFYGGRLANAGCDVHFLFHSEYKHVKEHGFQVDSVEGDFHLSDIYVYNNSFDMPKCDVVLVSLKSTQNHLLPQLLEPILHESSMVILIQNGLGLEAELALSFPQTTIVGGMAFICSSRVGLGHIQHKDYGSLNIGFYQHRNESVLTRFLEDCCCAGLTVTVADDLYSARWKKLVWNIPYNGLTVVLNATTEQIMRNSFSRQLVKELMEEVRAAALANGATIEESFILDMLNMTDEMRPYSPSMKLDWDNHRPLEIRSIYLNPIEEAKKIGCPMKKVEALSQILLSLSKNAELI